MGPQKALSYACIFRKHVVKFHYQWFTGTHYHPCRTAGEGPSTPGDVLCVATIQLGIVITECLNNPYSELSRQFISIRWLAGMKVLNNFPDFKSLFLMSRRSVQVQRTFIQGPGFALVTRQIANGESKYILANSTWLKFAKLANCDKGFVSQNMPSDHKTIDWVLVHV